MSIIRKKINAYAKLLRLPGLGGLAIPPVIGALSVGVHNDLYGLLMLFVIGAFSAIFGFVLNDYADVELDTLVKDLHGKPLVSGDIPRKHALAISFLCVLLAFFFVMILWRGKTLDDLKLLAFIGIFLAGVLGTMYNLYGKKMAGTDFLVALSMALVFLFGALSFGTPTLLTWVIFILTFNQTLHMNAVEGGIKDADHDFIMGVNNIALASGVKVEGKNIFIPLRFKAFGMGIRLCSAVLIFVPFVFYPSKYQMWNVILMALFIAGVLYLSIKLLTIKTFNRGKIQKLIGTQTFLRYSIIPIMLIPYIDLWIALILIVFPLAWYIVLTSLIGERLFRPRM
jgi:4-hydroxybenzoate polyprenyltransferase